MNVRSCLLSGLLSVLLAILPAYAATGGAAPDASPSEREFCRLDASGDRTISYEEFAACQFYRLEHMKRLPFVDLDAFPKDAKGNVAEEDLKRALFERADANKDLKIDRKEWEEFYRSVTAPY